MSVDNICSLLGLEKVRGDIGIEIEVEGERLPRINTPLWRTERDHSLKAQEAYEYVLVKPISKTGIGKAMALLNKSFKDNASVIHDSYRAGVHIHVNVGALTLVELANFVTLTICFENVLADFCGETRKGNLFCLRTQDAELIIDDWLQAFRRFNFSDQNSMKYGFVNLASVGRYGSLEFRGLYSTVDPQIIEQWSAALLRLREVAKSFDAPHTIIEDFSVKGPEAFCEEYINDLPWADTVGHLWRDVRRAQEFAFGLNWQDIANKNS